MTNTVEVEVLRPFHKTAQGDLADVGERLTVEATWAQELARSGLARAVEPDAKAARNPDNKMAPEHADKAETARPNKYARAGFSSRKKG